MAGTVQTGISDNSDKIVFWVKNDQVMSEEVQMQIFQRSFSTRAMAGG